VPGRSTQPISGPDPEGGPVTPRPGTASTGDPGFEAFRETVLGDPALQARLREILDWDRLAATVEELAAERGIRVTREDLRAARLKARRARVARGV
jgi:hypothetical protein